MKQTAVEWLEMNMPDISKHIPMGIALEFVGKFQYAKDLEKQFTPQWIKVTDFLPKIGHSVIVYVEYVSKGIDTNQTFCGYMDEDGDLISMPEDDPYGWSFAECVTHWMPLPEMPEV